jgi:hypothetical protein
MSAGLERGNIFVFIFIALILIALLTVAVRGTSGGKNNVTQEDLKIQAAQTLRTAAELESAVRQVLDNGASESEIRFAHTDAAADYGTIATTPEFQVFSKSGGRAEYRLAPSTILASGSGAWEFYGTTAIPRVGSDRPELIAVLPNVTAGFCATINKQLGLTNVPDDDVTGATPDCVQGSSTDRFGPSADFSSVPNTLDATTFDQLPMTQACVTCGANYHFYSVLMSR